MNLIFVVFLIFGLLVYGGIVFWSGTRGFWWLAALVSVPAIMGGLVSLSMDIPPSASPLFRNFEWLVLGQLAFGVVVYWAGRAKRRNASEELKDSY